MDEDMKENESQQCEMLLALAKIACAGSDCLKDSNGSSEASISNSCALCEGAYISVQDSRPFWNEKDKAEDWKNAIAAMLTITREPKFQACPKARVLLAVAVGRVFNHISDVDYLNLETCELGQWLLGSMSRSLRELKLAAT